MKHTILSKKNMSNKNNERINCLKVKYKNINRKNNNRKENLNIICNNNFLLLRSIIINYHLYNDKIYFSNDKKEFILK
jgi:hypothetical protein